MTTLNLSLPDSMRSFVQKQVRHGGYSSSSEYVRALLRQEQQRYAQSTLEAKLLEGMASGRPTEMTPRDWSDIRRAVSRRKSRSRK